LVSTGYSNGARVSHGTPAENYDNLRDLYRLLLLILMLLASILGYFKALRLKKSHSFWGSNPQTTEILLKLSAIIYASLPYTYCH